MELLLGLLCFFVSLVMVALLGHGLWLMMTAIFSALFGTARRETERPRRRMSTCVGCGESLAGDEERCPACGLHPDGKRADELRDLEAALRAVQRLQEQGVLSNETWERVYRCIEGRQADLQRRGRREPTVARQPAPIVQLESWFGVDLGKALTVEQKKESLALTRTLVDADWRQLSERALFGIVRLQVSLGMLSRAFEVCAILLDAFPRDPMTTRAAVEVLRAACRLEDWPLAERLAGKISDVPGTRELHPELADMIDQVQARRTAPARVSEPAVVAMVVPVLTPAGPSVPFQAPPDQTPMPMPAVAVEPPTTPAVPMHASEPIAPRRGFGEWFAAFMEESNILWGELIGGTLIVGCSIALVISLWHDLEKYPIVPFLIFAATTSALFGAGFYTLSHWKLESTSRGLLLIGTLLMPLNFVVPASMSRDPAFEAGLVDYATEIAALAVFGWCLVRSARILVQTPLAVAAPSSLLIASSMVLSAAAQLIAPRWLSQEPWDPLHLLLLALAPVAIQVGAMGWILWRLSALADWSIGQVVALLIALGSVTFACCVTLSFPLYATDDLAFVLPHLSSAFTLLGVPILIAGALMHQKLTAQGATTNDADRERFGLWRTIGTALALLGLFVMFGGFAMSIHVPSYRWISGTVNIVTLLGLAWWLRLSALHVPTQVYLAVLVVVGWTFDIDALINRPDAALRLTGLLVVQALIAEVLIRLGRTQDARYYAVGGGVSTALSGVLILPFATTHPGIAAIVFAVAASTWLASNLRWRLAEITYACSLVLAGAVYFAFAHFDVGPFAHRLLWSLLTHATVCLGAAVLLRFLPIVRDLDWLRDIFRIPLQFASLAASFVVTAVLVVQQVEMALPWTTSAYACGWLALLWLVLAVLEGWPALFGIFQIALAFTWFFAASARLTDLGWDWLEPHSLHIYALGLGGLSLAWECARLAARWQPRVLALLLPPFVPIDRLIAGGLVLGQLTLAVCAIQWGVGQEVSMFPDDWRVFSLDWQAHAFGPAAWLLPVVLAGVMLLWLRAFDTQVALLGLTLLLLTIPLLAAGTWFDEQQAVASALRWGLAVAYGLASALLWNRHRLGAERADQVPALAIRLLLIAAAVMPILLLSSIVVYRKLNHLPLPELGDGFFQVIGGPLSLLLPLGLTSAILAGHGFRERLAYYLLAAGGLANATSVGAYFLVLQRREVARDQPWVIVDMFLLASGIAWIGSITWTALARIRERNEPSRPLLDSPLLTLHALLGALGFGVALAPALTWVMFGNDETGRLWTQAIGSLPGWLAFGLMAFGSCFVLWTRRPSLPLHLAGVLSLTAVALSACTVETVVGNHGWVYLMIASALFSCVWVWGTLFLPPDQPPSWLTFRADLRESVVYAVLSAGLALLMSFSTLVTRDHPIESAQAVALTAAAFALLAYQRKTELWATLASLVLVFAGIILVHHFDRDNPHLGLHGIQVSLAILGGTTLLRLALHRFIASPTTTPACLVLLPVQIALGFLGNAVLLFFAFTSVILVPERFNAFTHEWLRLNSSVAGWLALSTQAASLTWYLTIRQPRGVVHVVALSGLLLGVVAAGTAESLFEGAWTAHHVLTLSWTLLALALMIVSWLSHARSALGPQFWPAEQRSALARRLQACFPESAARIWVTLCGLFVIVLALRAASVEPSRPWWSVGNTFAVSILLGTLAVWARAPIYIHASGLLTNVIGWLLFTAWAAHRNQAPGPMLGDEEWASYLILTQVLSFGVAAGVWSLLERLLRHKQIDLATGVVLPFTQTALLAGIHLLALVVGLANVLHLTGAEVRIGGLLAAISLGVLVAAAGLDLWRPRFHRFTRFQLYACGLVALGLILHRLQLSVPHWYLAVTLLLAGYVLLIVTLMRVTLASDSLRAMLHLPDEPETDGQWFWQVQLGTIGLVVALSAWIALAYAQWDERLGGAAACLLVTGAALLLVPIWPRIFAFAAESPEPDGLSRRLLPHGLVLSLGLIAGLEMACVLIEPTMRAVWMQRAAAAVTMLAAALLVYRFALPRILAGTAWVEAGRSLTASVSVLSLAMLGVLIAQELVLYDAAENVKRTPLMIGLAIPAGLAIVALVGCALYSALTREADLFGIEGEMRTSYVYLAELLALGLLVHVRLNLPDLPKVLGGYWYLSVMVLAFLGVALSEFFTRKNLPVLATPLKRSAMVLAFLPVLAFRLGPIAGSLDTIGQQVAGLQPFLRYLKGLGDLFLMESLCWLLLGVFFGWLARLRGSSNHAIFAALAVNFGVWVLLGHQDATTFLQRPQLWLIPLGLIVLVAEFVNRDRLGFWPSLSVRYVGLLCIYLSSTLELLKDGLGNYLLAIVLVLLAIAGMMLGILFRVRAFLLAGFLALLVVIFTQIWHAAVDRSQSWVWWVCGIVLGVLILGMFALFEKHRNEVLKMIDNMKRWH